jgi:hypothetical protein
MDVLILLTSLLLKLQTKIHSSFFVSKLSSYGYTFFDVNKTPSQNWTFALQFEYME